MDKGFELLRLASVMMTRLVKHCHYHCSLDYTVDGKKETRKIYVIFSGSASSTGIHVGPMAVPEVRGGWLGRRRLGLALRALPRLL